MWVWTKKVQRHTVLLPLRNNYNKLANCTFYFWLNITFRWNGTPAVLCYREFGTIWVILSNDHVYFYCLIINILYIHQMYKKIRYHKLVWACLCGAYQACKTSTHPAASLRPAALWKTPTARHGLTTPLPWGRQFCSIRSRTARLYNCFFPQAVQLLNTMLPHQTLNCFLYILLSLSHWTDYTALHTTPPSCKYQLKYCSEHCPVLGSHMCPPHITVVL